MKNKLVLLLLLFLFLNNLFILPVKAELNSNVELDLKNRYVITTNYNLDYQELNHPVVNYAKNIKGVYINFWTLSHKKKREDIIEAINGSNLNAIVVDVKDIRGNTPFVSSSINSINYNLNKSKFKDLISKWQKKGIYVIGRLPVFKDYALANQFKEYSLKYLINTDDGSVIVNSKKWTNPYSQKVWNYNIAIAEKMAELGLDEIQFDYVRFPTLSTESKLTIKPNKNSSRSDAIVGFLKEAKKRLGKYNLIISADLFGLTTTVEGDLGIGQDITRIAKHVDYISPMIYPSHYSKGMYGIKNPAASPYQIIANSLEDAKNKLSSDANKIRPWLQDFSLYHSYTKKEIEAQIKAVEDKELSSWLLWNPRSIYTIEALISNDKEGDV